MERIPGDSCICPYHEAVAARSRARRRRTADGNDPGDRVRGDARAGNSQHAAGDGVMDRVSALPLDGAK